MPTRYTIVKIMGVTRFSQALHAFVEFADVEIDQRGEGEERDERDGDDDVRDAADSTKESHNSLFQSSRSSLIRRMTATAKTAPPTEMTNFAVSLASRSERTADRIRSMRYSFQRVPTDSVLAFSRQPSGSSGFLGWFARSRMSGG
jgi:hypothetical protein